jgi:hypothetical protein
VDDGIGAKDVYGGIAGFPRVLSGERGFTLIELLVVEWLLRGLRAEDLLRNSRLLATAKMPHTGNASSRRAYHTPGQVALGA